MDVETRSIIRWLSKEATPYIRCKVFNILDVKEDPNHDSEEDLFEYFKYNVEKLPTQLDIFNYMTNTRCNLLFIRQDNNMKTIDKVICYPDEITNKNLTYTNYHIKPDNTILKHKIGHFLLDNDNMTIIHTNGSKKLVPIRLIIKYIYLTYNNVIQYFKSMMDSDHRIEKYYNSLGRNYVKEMTMKYIDSIFVSMTLQVKICYMLHSIGDTSINIDNDNHEVMFNKLYDMMISKVNI